MLSSLDLHFRQKKYYCLYLFFTVTEKSSSDKQAYFFYSAWIERQHLQLQAPELQRRQPEAGKALWQGTPAWTACAFILPQHLLLTVSQYGTAGLMDLCSDPLWMMQCYNLSEKVSWACSLAIHLAGLTGLKS